ncbi:hypothetical protein [Alkalispirochaeta alkalica]|uniref:hypothetical protein n=1 Tax=Alkalispirochaeta alkalica TaxID=46356 RepID=UPI000379C83C|nr:hypothetical protein [Alkalispirochaeta alkalica]
MLRTFEVHAHGIRRIWLLRESNASIRSRLLPTPFPEIICTRKSPIYYNSVRAVAFHLRGGFPGYSTVRQEGVTDNVGITLDPEIPGFLTGQKASVFSGTTRDASRYPSHFLSTLKELLLKEMAFEKTAQGIVSFFETLVLPEPEPSVQIVKNFMETGSSAKVGDFCRVNGISTRSLERYFSRLVGLSPMAVLQLRLFQENQSSSVGKLL